MLGIWETLYFTHTGYCEKYSKIMINLATFTFDLQNQPDATIVYFSILGPKYENALEPALLYRKYTIIKHILYMK